MADEEKKPEGEQQEEPKGDEEKAKAEAAKEAEWNKDKQRADQADANRVKVSAERDDLQGTLTETQAKVAKLEGELKAKAEAAGLKLSDLDPDTADVPDVVRQNKTLSEEVRSQREELSRNRDALQGLEEKEAARQQKADEEAAQERVLKPLDKKYGAKFRNEALDLANKMADERGKPPADTIDAYLLLEAAYSQLAEADKEDLPKTKKKVPVDTGAGGAAVPQGATTGTMEEVMADMRSKGAFAGDLPSQQ